MSSFSYLILVPIDVGTVGDACPDDVFLASAGSMKQLFVLCRLRGRTMAATNLKKEEIRRKMQLRKKTGRTKIPSLSKKLQKTSQPLPCYIEVYNWVRQFQKRPRRCRERFAVLTKKKKSGTRKMAPYRLFRICSLPCF